MRTLWLTLLSSFLVLSSGCSAVIEQIQQVTGNEIKNVSEKTQDPRDNVNEEKQIYEQGIPHSPTPSLTLRDILNDEGEGRYVKDPYEAQKVNQALNLMPEGLSVDKVYAYLLGLVGENYKHDLNSLSIMLGPNYQGKMRVYEDRATPSISDTTKGKPSVPSSPKPPKQSNVVILVDVSSTMATVYQRKTRYDWAKEFSVHLLRQLPKETNVTVRLYGHKGGYSKKEKADSCGQTQEIYHAGPTLIPQLMTNFSKFKPTGWSPLVEALHTSLEELSKHQSAQVENTIYVVADSSDTCGVDLSQEISVIQSSKLGVMVNVVGIDVPAKDENELSQLAEATGGDYQPIANPANLEKIARVHATELKQINQPWQLRAIQKMVKDYQVANERLDNKYQSIVTDLHEEQQRLADANKLVKQQHKIDSAEWKKINGWINSRYQGVLGFTEQKWHSKKAELDQSYTISMGQMEQKWQQDKAALKPYEPQKQSLLKQAKQLLPNTLNDSPRE